MISSPEEIYAVYKNLIAVLPKDIMTKMLIKQVVEQLNLISQTVKELRSQMNHTVSQLPEYSVVMATKGVGSSLGLYSLLR